MSRTARSECSRSGPVSSDVLGRDETDDENDRDEKDDAGDEKEDDA